VPRSIDVAITSEVIKQSLCKIYGFGRALLTFVRNYGLSRLSTNSDSYSFSTMLAVTEKLDTKRDDKI